MPNHNFYFIKSNVLHEKLKQKLKKKNIYGAAVLHPDLTLFEVRAWPSR